MATIGLDIGTTGCKATAADILGATLCEDYREYDLILGPGGRVELDPRAVWEAVKSALKTVSAACSEEITSLAAASFGEAAVLLDRNGNVMANSIFFTDARGYEAVEEIGEALEAGKLEARTGMPLNGMYTLPKLLWVRRNQPELFERIHRILPFGSYITYLLTGEVVCDHSLASRTLLFDRHREDWDFEALAFLGVTPEQLPSSVRAGTLASTILKTAAAETGLPENVRIVVGCHDQVAAALGAGVLLPGQAVDGMGSAECITAMLPEDAHLAPLFENSVCAEPYPAGSGFVSLLFGNTAGAALKWYKTQMETQRAAACKAGGESIFKLLDGELSDTPSPLLFLPHLSGSGTPYMDASSRGLLYGLTLSSTRRDIYRALIEGMNYEMRLNLEIFRKCGLEVSSLTAAGGGAVRVVLQIKADILGLPVRILQNPQSGTAGLSMLCAVVEGRYSSPEEAAKEMARVQETLEPRAALRDAYNQAYDKYTRLYRAGKMIESKEERL